MSLSFEEIFETIRMIGMEHLDIRTTTLGISLFDCATGSGESTAKNVYEKVVRIGKALVPAAKQIELEHGIPIINKRVSITPVALLGVEDPLPIALALDKAASEIGIDFLGGYTALVADACCIIPTVNADTITPHSEAFQAVIWHLLVSHPKLKAIQTKWESAVKP